LTLLLRAEQVVVRYGATLALDHLSLELDRGELVAVLGPSGSGKTTLLNAVAGFIELADGEIWLRDRVVSRPGWTLPPERRRVGVVFQSYALWPHMSVLETVAYPFRQRGIRANDARDRARELLERVGLLELQQRQPGELSGGQQQRVGLARALAVEPDLFLFDEPTANLDPSLRASLQTELRQRQRESGAGGLYVTHDPGEALSIADEVAIVRNGRLVQQGSPEAVYTCPSDEWVATLTGPASILDGRVAGDNTVVLDGGQTIQCTVRAGARREAGKRMCVRPEWVTILYGSTHPDPPALARVRAVRFHGPHTDYELETSAGPLLARQAGPPRHDVGEGVTWTLSTVALVG
jgi:iron(III) transport system ATP-binding protein